MTSPLHIRVCKTSATNVNRSPRVVICLLCSYHCRRHNQFNCLYSRRLNSAVLVRFRVQKYNFFRIQQRFSKLIFGNHKINFYFCAEIGGLVAFASGHRITATAVPPHISRIGQCPNWYYAGTSCRMGRGYSTPS